MRVDRRDGRPRWSPRRLNEIIRGKRAIPLTRTKSDTDTAAESYALVRWLMAASKYAETGVVSCARLKSKAPRDEHT